MSEIHRPPVATLLAIPVVVAIALTLFAWPAANLAPRDLPVGVAGPAQAAGAVEQQLARQGDAFDVRRYADESAAREAIREREVYGAVVASPAGPTLLTASAASATVAQLLEQAVAGRDARVVDVVPAPADDPRGAALGATLLPLVLAGIVTAVLAGALAAAGARQIAAVLAGSVLAGVAATAIAQGWLGVLDGGWLANAAVLSLFVLATAAAVAGLQALLGYAGVAVGTVLMVLVGNPLSGMASAPELLPKAAGAIGQLLPPGAGGQLVRSTAFFDGNGAVGPVSVLVAWSLLGLAAIAIGAAAARRRPAAPAPAAAGRRQAATSPVLR
jgi:hypothetical protein